MSRRIKVLSFFEHLIQVEFGKQRGFAANDRFDDP